MSMKRKRSSVTLCASTFDITSLPLPQCQDKSRLPEYFSQSRPLDNLLSQNACFQKPQLSPDQHNPEPSYLNSRTRKRYRDARPEESQIHATTVTRLFEAQKQPNNLPSSSQSTTQSSRTQNHHQFFTPQPQHPQKSTLHSFWTLPTTSPQHGAPVEMQTERMVCEDCDRQLVQQDAMDVDIDQDTACMACGRHVCDTCSIATESRLCLSCAMH